MVDVFLRYLVLSYNLFLQLCLFEFIPFRSIHVEVDDRTISSPILSVTSDPLQNTEYQNMEQRKHIRSYIRCMDSFPFIHFLRTNTRLPQQNAKLWSQLIAVIILLALALLLPRLLLLLLIILGSSSCAVSLPPPLRSACSSSCEASPPPPHIACSSSWKTTPPASCEYACPHGCSGADGHDRASCRSFRHSARRSTHRGESPAPPPPRSESPASTPAC